MEPMANESHPTSTYDDTESPLTQVEKAVTDLQCDNALLRQRMDSGFAGVQAQFALTEEKLRREFHDALHALEQRLNAKIEAESHRLESKFSSEIQIVITRMDRLETKLDLLTKWLIGAQVTTMAFVAGIAVQLFLR
ncbi:hypothetical protein GTP46_21975 [Duganella sp. FT135W]|uniref:DUF1640 domain-containing protein n=1 Tax=Duganella flavida TaxID=2692175 RepID=A0A6L8KCX0_9BURK|nr:hypothetical protein [Duganella flavida]MYM25303.1 hypothetical protein [Duganella flavida]